MFFLGCGKRIHEKERHNKDFAYTQTEISKIPSAASPTRTILDNEGKQNIYHQIDRLLDAPTNGVDVYNSSSRSTALELADISILQLAELFNVFQGFLTTCPNLRAKLNTVRKTKIICKTLLDQKEGVALESVSDTSDNSSLAVQPLLEEILAEPMPLRLRHALAIYRFCSELEQEYEDEDLGCDTGFLMSLQKVNFSGGPSDNAKNTFIKDASTMKSPSVARCPDLDLAKIYRNLLRGGNYLPTAAEMNEILIRSAILLREEPNVVLVPLPAVVVGDIHGQICDVLEHIMPAGGPLVSEQRLRSAATAIAIARKNQQQPTREIVDRLQGNGGDKKQGRNKDNRRNPAANLVAVATRHRSCDQNNGMEAKSKASSISTKSVSSGADAAGTKAKEAENSNGAAKKHDSAVDDAASSTYLFLGDYVDRGMSGLRCVCLLFVAKLLSPDTVFLLRGNHECRHTNRNYGFLEECHRMYPVLNGQVSTSASVTPATVNADGSVVECKEKTKPKKGKKPSCTKIKKDPNGKPDVDSDSESDEGRAMVAVVDEAKQEKLPIDDMGWDLSDHPFWLSANEAFECLPLCAALYEQLPQAGGKASDKVPETDGAAGALAIPSGRTSMSSQDAGAEETSTSTTAPPAKMKESAPHTAGLLSKCGGGDRARKQQVRVCAMHGGLSPYIEDSFEGIIAINRFRDIETGALADLTWSDPIENEHTLRHSVSNFKDSAPTSSKADVEGDEGDKPTLPPATGLSSLNVDFTAPIVYDGPPMGFTFSARGTGHNFGQDVTCAFLKANSLYYIIRAHQCIHEGFQWVHDHRVLTVFSAPNYCGMGNKGCIALLNAQGMPTLVQYQYIENEGNNLNEARNGFGRIQAPVPPQEFL